MPKRMLIDASHPEETRVVILDGNRVEEFDFEAATKRPLKGNIYLAKVTRVEPSLQAAFVEYGGNRQGFLAFSEIHPDYYQIPVADKIALLEAQTRRMMAEEEFDPVETGTVSSQGNIPSDEHGEYDHSEHASQDHAGEENEETESHNNNDEQHGHDEAESSHDDSESYSEAQNEWRTHSSEQIDSGAAGESSGQNFEAGENVVSGTGGEFHSSEPHAENQNAQSGDPASQDPNVVQSESTGAPAAYQRSEARPNDRNRSRPPRRRQYKIQEVIKRRQIMLIQVVKEERGNKGASLTTFLSLAGRYCVLMPNTPRGGGISRKITSPTDRKRLKAAAQSLELPEGMGLIIRTAGANRTKLEIKRDYEYLLRLWDTVRELTLHSNAPALVYEEGSLIKRVIRDLYNKDISEIVVDGDAGYRDAKDFMRMLMPSHAKNVKPYKADLPLFQSYHVEAQLDAMFSPVVNLRSGGYIVINQTEALVSIDVNSGKATREHSIEETASKTNLEAADEIARQLRLRDLAGLIVIDFIDMEDGKNDRNVEKRLHNAVRNDRARIQIGKISQFGLLEMSRQRLRAGVLAGSTVTCPHCAGQGIIRSTESAALRLLRALEEEGQRQPAANILVKAPSDVVIYTLNQKRRELARIEEAHDLAITFDPQAHMMGGSLELERIGVRIPTNRPKSTAVTVEAGFQEPEEQQTEVSDVETEAEPEQIVEPVAAERDPNNAENRGRKRRRRRRGGRGRGPGPHAALPHGEGEQGAGIPLAAHEAAEGQNENFASDSDDNENASEAIAGNGDEEREAQPGVPLSHSNEPQEKRRRRRRGRRGRRREGEPGATASEHSHEAGAGDLPLSTPSAFSAAPMDDVPMPNAPSSPVWSLSEPVRESLPSGAEKSFEPPPPQPVSDAIATISGAGAPAPAEAGNAQVSEIPGQSRKGWWQRRFKL